MNYDMNTAELQQPKQDGCCHPNGPSEEVGSEDGPGFNVFLPRHGLVLVLRAGAFKRQQSPEGSLMVNDSELLIKRLQRAPFPALVAVLFSHFMRIEHRKS